MSHLKCHVSVIGLTPPRGPLWFRCILNEAIQKFVFVWIRHLSSISYFHSHHCFVAFYSPHFESGRSSRSRDKKLRRRNFSTFRSFLSATNQAIGLSFRTQIVLESHMLVYEWQARAVRVGEVGVGSNRVEGTFERGWRVKFV